MHTKTSLLGGAAIGLVATLAFGATADAAPKHHHKATARHADAGLSAEVRELKAEVESLQQTLAAQAAAQQQIQAQAQAAQARADESAAAAQAAQAKLDTQIEQIPGTVKTAIASAPPPDSLRMKGIKITPGGFIEAATIYRSKNLGQDLSTSYNSIPYGNSRVGHTAEERFSARQSRLSLLAQGDVNPTTHLAMYGEFDFLGAAQTANSNESNSFTPRIRHFYGAIDWDTWGLHFLGGQNWSLVTMNTKGISPRNELTPAVIEAQYVPGFVWARQPQLRIVKDFDKTIWVGASVENPQTTIFSAGSGAGAGALPSNLTFNTPAGSGFASSNTLSLNHLPDVVVKAAYEAPIAGFPVHAEVFGIYRDFYSRLGSSNNDVAGGGFGGGAVVSVVPKVLDLQVSGLAGKGVGRYGSSQLPDVTFDAQGNIRPIQENMILAGATLHANPALDVYLYAGREQEKARVFAGPTGLAYGYGNPLYLNTGCFTEGSSATCNGNTKEIDQVTGGFWHKPYVGKYGKVQWGVQYSYTERKAFQGVGGAPKTNENMVFTSFRYYPF
jgi:hypothetical protein